MEFKKYQHVERFGTDEVSNIELGECFVFPKIDGTNSSLWLNGHELKAGSRNRELSLENDNAGFYAWALEQDYLIEYLKENPENRIFGEWLVPHSLKTYREDSWRKFYVFDVAIDKGEELEYLHYDKYHIELDSYGINFIPPICVIKNASYEQLVNQLQKNVFLIEDGKGVGEGIVLKNYDFRNRFGRMKWAKIVTSEFKEKHSKVMGYDEIQGKKRVEESICEKFVTKALCEKVYSKIKLDGWTSKRIPQLLNTVYYDLVREDSWNFVKAHKDPTIDFRNLRYFCFEAVKNHLPELF